MKKSKMPIQDGNNALGHCSNKEELEDLPPLEVMLVSQIPFILIVGKTKGAAQHELKRTFCFRTSRS